MSIVVLDLSHTSLSDKDLKQIAESGYFTSVRTLILCNTPGISAKGLLEQVGETGFPNLEWLDISHNAQFTGPHLQGWIGTEDFKRYIKQKNLILLARDSGEPP